MPAGVGAIEEDLHITDLREYCGLWRRGRGVLAREVNTSNANISSVSPNTVVSIDVDFDADRRYRIAARARYIVSDSDGTERVCQQRILIDGSIRDTTEASIFNTSTSRSKTVRNTIDGIELDGSFTVLMDALRAAGPTSLTRRGSADVPSELTVYDAGGSALPSGSDGQP